MISAFIIKELRGARALRLFCGRSSFPPPILKQAKKPTRPAGADSGGRVVLFLLDCFLPEDPWRYQNLSISMPHRGHHTCNPELRSFTIEDDQQLPIQQAGGCSRPFNSDGPGRLDDDPEVLLPFSVYLSSQKIWTLSDGLLIILNSRNKEARAAFRSFCQLR